MLRVCCYFICVLWASCLAHTVALAGEETTPVYGYQVINRYAHDPTAFTQGLVFHSGRLYESTGLYGESTLREVDLKSGRVVRGLKLPDRVFGEGLTLWGERLIQLSWRAGTAFVFDLKTLALIKQFRYSTEGWGLTHDARHLIMSDGSARLYFRDPETFHLLRTLNVTDQGVAVEKINELEYVAGHIYANIWMQDRIAKISASTGKVLAWIDLRGLKPFVAKGYQDYVLNGIAYDAQTEHFYVTGKKWPVLYEIRINVP